MAEQMQNGEGVIDISYGETSTVISNLRAAANEINSCFDEYQLSVHRVGAEDVFYGAASESFQDSYTKYKPKLDEFVRLVNEFADTISGASTETSAAEAEINKEAQSLK